MSIIRSDFRHICVYLDSIASSTALYKFCSSHLDQNHNNNKTNKSDYLKDPPSKGSLDLLPCKISAEFSL